MTIILPPCIQKAAKARDHEALDEIFEYFNTYGTEGLEPVLWSIGYLDFNNYNSKKLSAMSQISSASHFPCTVFEKPEHLSKYCSEADMSNCPLRNPVTKARMLIKEVSIVPGEYPLTATIKITLHNGREFIIENMTYLPTNTYDFYAAVARQFKTWYSELHKGYKFPDILTISDDDFVELLMEISTMKSVEVDSNEPDVTAMHT